MHWRTGQCWLDRTGTVSVQQERRPGQCRKRQTCQHWFSAINPTPALNSTTVIGYPARNSQHDARRGANGRARAAACTRRRIEDAWICSRRSDRTLRRKRPAFGGCVAGNVHVSFCVARRSQARWRRVPLRKGHECGLQDRRRARVLRDAVGGRRRRRSGARLQPPRGGVRGHGARPLHTAAAGGTRGRVGVCGVAGVGPALPAGADGPRRPCGVTPCWRDTLGHSDRWRRSTRAFSFFNRPATATAADSFPVPAARVQVPGRRPHRGA